MAAMLSPGELKLEMERRGLAWVRSLEFERLRLAAERDEEYRIAFLKILGAVEARRDSDPVKTSYELVELVDAELERVGMNNLKLLGGDPDDV